MPYYLRLLALSAILALMGMSASSEELDVATLDQIKATAAALCGDFQSEGTESEANIEGTAQARLKGLSSILANAGIEGTGQLASTEYVGVLREDLGAEKISIRDCNVKILQALLGEIRVGSTSGVAAKESTRDLFAMNGGTSTEITPDGIFLTMIGTPYAARGDLVGISIDGKATSLSVGGKLDITYSEGTCHLFLSRLFRGENRAEFVLRC